MKSVCNVNVGHSGFIKLKVSFIDRVVCFLLLVFFALVFFLYKACFRLFGFESVVLFFFFMCLSFETNAL